MQVRFSSDEQLDSENNSSVDVDSKEINLTETAVVPKARGVFKQIFLSKRIDPKISSISLSSEGKIKITHFVGHNAHKEELPYHYMDGDKNKPVILIKSACTEKNEVYLADRGIFNIARTVHVLVEEGREYYNIIITGNRKIIKVIDMIRNDGDNFSQTKNEDLFNVLGELRRQCMENQNNKTPKNAPIKSETAFNYLPYENSDLNILPSVNQVMHVYKWGTNEEYIQKKYFHGNHLAQMEAFISYLYFIVLGDPAPKAKPLHRLQGEKIPGQIHKTKREGIVYSKIDNFKTFYSAVKKKKMEFSPKLLSKMGVANVLAASLFFQEDDLHANNWGLVEVYHRFLLLTDELVEPKKGELEFKRLMQRVRIYNKRRILKCVVMAVLVFHMSNKLKYG